MSYTSGVRRVRRLGTTSKVKNPSYQFTTEWQWWWLDIGGHWRLYGEQVCISLYIATPINKNLSPTWKEISQYFIINK